VVDEFLLHLQVERIASLGPGNRDDADATLPLAAQEVSHD
jgi:hypothetical protein